VFRNPSLTYAHLDYPILQPLLEASFFRAVGGVDLRLWHVELWVVFAAAIWTLGWLLAPLGGRRPWVVVLAVLSVSPLVVSLTSLGNADATMAGLLGCATLSLGIWLERGGRAHVVLGALLLAGAASVKNDGLAYAAAVLVALAAVVLVQRGRGRGRRRDLALGGALFVGGVLPWQLYTALNSSAQTQTPSPWEVVTRPEFLADRLSFLWRGLEQVAVQQVNGSTWGLIVPAFLVLGGVLLAVGRHRPLVAFYGLAWFLGVLAIAYTYWVTVIGDLQAFEERTGPRIAAGSIFVAAAGLAHLMASVSAEPLGELPADDRAEPAERELAAGVP